MRKPAAFYWTRIQHLRAEGLSYAAIGRRLGLSKSRIHKICHKYRTTRPRLVLPPFPGIVALARTAHVRAYWSSPTGKNGRAA